jgi:hypothetical protein
MEHLVDLPYLVEYGRVTFCFQLGGFLAPPQHITYEERFLKYEV